MEKKNEIVEGVIWKQILIFFFPILFGTFFQQLYTTVDAVIVGNFVGKEALAAVGGTTGTLINLLVGFFMGVSSGASVIISQYFGSRDKTGLNRSVHTAVAMGIAGGFLLMCLGLLLAPFMLEIIGVNEEIMGHALTYIRIYFCGMIPMAVYNIGAGILRAVGDSRRPLYYLIAAVIANIILDILFVAVFQWGIAGAAAATMISQILNAALTYRFLIRCKEHYAIAVKEIRFYSRELKKMLHLGIPAGMQAVMYAVSNIIIQAGINTFGTDSIAACTVFEKLDGMFWMIMSAFGVSITTFVGQNFGARQYDRVKKSVRTALMMTMGTAVVLCGFCVFICKYFILLFTNDPNVISIGVSLIQFLMPMYVTYVCIEVLSGAVRGTGDSWIPMIITCLGVCVLRVLWMYLVMPRWHDLHLLMLSYPVSWTVTSIVFIIYYRWGGWMKRSARKMHGEEL